MASWFPKQRNYELEKTSYALPREETTSHPLKGITVSESKAKKGTSKGASGPAKPVTNPLMDPLSMAMEGSDPLSQFAAASDPLSQMASQMSLENKSTVTSQNEDDDTFEPWSARKAAILSKYTTSEKLSITTSFLSTSDKERVIIKQQSTVSDKVKNRLDQLDDIEEGSLQEMLNLSQQDYVNKIEDLNSALCSAWDMDQRVKALKIAIQCAKLLADVSVIQFYPSKFVLITDILDTFGKLVYQRIRTKSLYYPPGSNVPVQLPEKFTPDQVPESAKETCRNWFFKIASIRELIPRLYVETAILKCYSFLNPEEYKDTLLRLASSTRGIGDPLVSIYAKCYLCRVGMDIAPHIRDHQMPCYNDFLSSYSQLQSDSVQNTLASQNMEIPKYLTLYCPALDWILHCIARQTTDKTLTQILSSCKENCNSALLLNSIMSAFKPEFIAARAMQFTVMIRECEETGFPKHMLYRSLGLCVVLADPPEDQKLTVLNEVWKTVMKLRNPEDYISCAEVWIEYVVKHFGKREINTILADIIKHMMPDRAFEDFYGQLQSVVSKIMVHITDFSMLFGLDKFMQFIDLFQKDTVKVDVCRTIMEGYSRCHQGTTNDPVIINSLMFVCKTMHDSVNALTLDDEKRALSNLICSFIHSISFGRDFEQQLSFYVEARASFTNLDIVLVQLIQSVNNLAILTRNVVKGNHSRKTAAFVRACAAYTFITIPSLQSVFSRLHLYLMSAQVAMLNGCLSQADAFYKAAVSCILEVPKTVEIDGKMKSAEPLLVQYVSNFLSSLLIVPDNPDQGVLYLVRGVLNVLEQYSWDTWSEGKVMLYTNALCMLSACCQDVYLYHADKVDSNDALYGGDQKFVQEVKKISDTLVENILGIFKVLGQSDEGLKKQSALSLHLFSVIVAHGDLSQSAMFTLATNLWGLVQKHGYGDTKQMVRIMDEVKHRGMKKEGKEYKELSSKMSLQSRA